MSEPAIRVRASTSPIGSALRTLAVMGAGIAALEAALADARGDGQSLARRFGEAVGRIAGAHGRVIVTGMGKSGHIGRKIAATLASTGTPSHFVHPAEASHGDLGMIQADDVVLALSWSGETAELASIITYSRRFRILLVAMTSSADSTLGRAADICLVLPKTEEACPHGLAPTTSTLLQLALGDALAVALLEEKGFTAQKFRVLHPGGKLGARLTFVRDVMHRGERIPLVPAGARMGQAVVEMSGKGLGCVGVVDAAGRLAGIVTDGDLRRHMKPDLMADAVESVMTPSPITIAPDAMAAEAIEILNSKKKTVLIVVDDDNRPAGIVHIHDLLRLGAA